jgi:hypothetical protein
MKKFYLLLIFILLLGCSDKPFTGYIVGKEYTPGHWSNHKSNPIECSSFSHPLHPLNPLNPVYRHNNNHTTTVTYIKSKFIWYIANKKKLIKYEPDSLTFFTKNCGDTVTVIH